jgi:hypothetical protein
MKTDLPIIPPPELGEHAPYYAQYISLVAGSDVLEALERQRHQTAELLSCCSEADGELRYAPEKWSIKEVVGHLIDVERILGYRALRISRNDKNPIEGFEQDDYVRDGPFNHCRLSDLGEEFGYVRGATVCLLRSLNQEAWMRRGVANKNEISVRALAYVIAGHELHHRRILQEKYLPLLTRQ